MGQKAKDKATEKVMIHNNIQLAGVLRHFIY